MNWQQVQSLYKRLALQEQEPQIPPLGQASEPTAACNVCGQPAMAARKSRIILQGVPQASPQGASLVHGAQGLIEGAGWDDCPWAISCERCDRRLEAVLNRLLSPELQVGLPKGPIAREAGSLLDAPSGLALLFWSERGTKVPLGLLQEPSARALGALEVSYLDDLMEQREHPSRPEAVHIWVLMGQKGRVRLIEKFESTTIDLKYNLVSHFKKFKLVSLEPGQSASIPSLRRLRQLAGVAHPDGQYSLSPHLLIGYLKSALLGQPMPMGLQYTTLAAAQNLGPQDPQRFAEQMSVLRAVYNDHTPPEETETLRIKEELDREQKDRVYRAGRLLAVLLELQNEVLESTPYLPKASYGGVAWGRMLKGLLERVDDYLADLRPKRRRTYQARLEELMGAARDERLEQTLEPREQVRLLLGYYQEQAENKERGPGTMGMGKEGKRVIARVA